MNWGRGPRAVGAARGVGAATAVGVMLVLIAGAVMAPAARAETGYDAWLRHAPITDAAVRARYDALPAAVATLGDSVVLAAARDELVRSVRGALGRTLRIEAASSLPREPAILLGTLRAFKARLPTLALPAALPDDAYVLKTATVGRVSRLVVAAANERGVLYGAFALARKIDLGEMVDRARRDARALRAGAHARPLGQPRRHDRARLCRRVDLLREGRRRRRSHARARLRAADGVGRHQRLLDQQRQRQPARDRARLPAAAGARRRGLSSLGGAAVRLDRLQQPAAHRRARHVRPARRARGRLLEEDRRRRSTARSPTSAASCSRPTPKGASAHRPTAAPTPTPPT